MMGKVDYSVVLSDELLDQFYLFKKNGHYDEKLVQRLLRYYKPLYFTNISQVERIGHEPDFTLRINLLKSDYKSQSLEELAKITQFKIILCTDRTDFPYVNINGDVIESNYSGTFLRSDSRLKAISHIKALCADAKNKVIVYDKYFSNQRNNIEILKGILPKRKLEIEFDKGSFSLEQQNALKAECPAWILKEKILLDCHDRYLIVDDKTEIVLTSGFQYLNEKTKELTYLVRRINGHQFG